MPERAVTIAETIDGLRATLDAERAAGRTVALVPTMGALHNGHLALVERARQLADVVVVSIFINPLQFGQGEDLDRYPRTLESDLAALSRGSSAFTSANQHGSGGEISADQATIVFAPAVAEMYPDGEPQTHVAAGRVAMLFEGATRPGHFDGMLTVVAKLLGIVQPDVVVFGQKDAQQVFLVTSMVADLNLPVRLDVVETVREVSGLALSSRNRYLDAEGARAALVLSAALEAAAASAVTGSREVATSAVTGPDAARAAARAIVSAEPLVDLDYVELVDPATFLPVAPDFRGVATAIIAAQVGATRLIDNRSVSVG